MVVCDSGPLIHLSRVGQIQMLKKLFDSVLIPLSVYRETVIEARALRKPGASSIEKAIEDGWIKVMTLDLSETESAKTLAEHESIELEDAEMVFSAQEHSASLVTNDKWLVRIAESLGIDALWTSTLVLLAAKQRILSRTEAKDLLRKLVLTGLPLRTDVYEAILAALEEM